MTLRRRSPSWVGRAAHGTRNRRPPTACATGSLPGRSRGQHCERETPSRRRAVLRRTHVLRARQPDDDAFGRAPVRAGARRIDQVVITSAIRAPVTSVFVCHLIASFGFSLTRPGNKKARPPVVRTGPGNELRRSSRRRSPHGHVRADDCDESIGSAWAWVLLATFITRKARARHGSYRPAAESKGGSADLPTLPPATRRRSSGRGNYVVERAPKMATASQNR
jgi:hypothetical protein